MAQKQDGRGNNGGKGEEGLTEDQQLVRGPATLIQAMRDRAKAEDRTINKIWRKAAELYLKTRVEK